MLQTGRRGGKQAWCGKWVQINGMCGVFGTLNPVKKNPKTLKTLSATRSAGGAKASRGIAPC